MITKIPNNILESVEAIMTIPRLVKTGLFIKLPPPTEEVRADSFLFKKVLDRALLDQFDDDENYRLQSKLWATLDNPDFCEVCDLALLEPEDVLTLFQIVGKVFRKKNEDKYWEEDLITINKMTKEDREYYLNYIEDV